MSIGSFSSTGESGGEPGRGTSLGDTGGGTRDTLEGESGRLEMAFWLSEVDCVACLELFASPVARLALSLSSRESFLPVDEVLGAGLALRPR